MFPLPQRRDGFLSNGSWKDRNKREYVNKIMRLRDILTKKTLIIIKAYSNHEQ
jgi:hypothetical protein